MLSLFKIFISLTLSKVQVDINTHAVIERQEKGTFIFIVCMMKTTLRFFSLILIWFIVDGYSLSITDVRIDHHKVETSRDLMINTARPRFSWKIHTSNERNVLQRAYQLQIQSEESFRFDTGRIVSSQSIHVPYTGQDDLQSSTYYRLRLRIWTMNSNDSSQWTDWIRFRTAIFNLHEYLTMNSSAVWIGSTEINMNELRKEFTVPNTSPIKSAIVYISGIGYYELYLNGNKVDLSRKLDPGWTPYEKRTLVVSFDLTTNITVREILTTKE